MKKKFTLFLLALLLIQLALPVFTSVAATANVKNVDITSSSVREDLASMGEDKLTYLSDTKNVFIGMSQYYDLSDKLRTYVYFNYIGSTDEDLKISISTSVTDENYNITEAYKDYDLRFVNNDSTWVKYEVLNLPNLDFVTRRYKIAEIFSATSTILSIDETYIFHGITNDSIEVLNQYVETITITDKEVRFFCYGDESSWFDFWGIDGYLGDNKKYTDAWYIFFNTDKPIDNLLEVEITYMPYDYHIQCLGGCKMSKAFTEAEIQNRLEAGDFDEKTTCVYGKQTVVTITPGTTKVSATTNWWGGYETTYRELDNIMDLREYESMDEDGNVFVFTEQAEKYTWGVNFFNTEKTSYLKSVNLVGQSSDSIVVDGTGVCNTALLRLKYEINGIVKNAYCIDIPTDDFEGSDAEEDFGSLKELFERLASLILLVLLIVVVVNVGMPVLMPLSKFFINCCVLLLSVVWSFIRLPFKILFTNRRK